MKIYNKTSKNILVATIFLVVFSCAKTNKKSDKDIVNKTTVVENLPNITDYPIVGTNQTTSYNNVSEISKPKFGDDFYGQNSN